LAAFWAEALGYVIQPPPDGDGPRLYFQRVPEAKTVKNRVHLDLNVGGPNGTPPDERRGRVDAEVERLVAAGVLLIRAME